MFAVPGCHEVRPTRIVEPIVDSRDHKNRAGWIIGRGFEGTRGVEENNVNSSVEALEVGQVADHDHDLSQLDALAVHTQLPPPSPSPKFVPTSPFDTRTPISSHSRSCQTFAPTATCPVCRECPPVLFFSGESCGNPTPTPDGGSKFERYIVPFVLQIV